MTPFATASALAQVRPYAPSVHQVLISTDPQRARLTLSVDVQTRHRRVAPVIWLLRLDRLAAGTHQLWQGQALHAGGLLEIDVELTDWPREDEPTQLRLWLRDPQSNGDWVLAEDSPLP